MKKPSLQHYALVAAPDEKHTLVCFSLDSARPDAYMAALEGELQKSQYRGDVLLDLLATNGEGSRRFMRLHFDGERLHWLRAKIAPLATIDSEILHFCQHFYATHATALDKSVLSPAARHRLKSAALAEA